MIVVALNESVDGTGNNFAERGLRSDLISKRLFLASNTSTTTSLQALYLMNSEFLQEQSRRIAAKLPDPQRAFPAIFGRPPKASELETSKQFLDKLQSQYAAAGEAQPQTKAWGSYIHAMLSSNPFLFVE